MATKTPGGAPAPQTDAERQLVEQLGKEGGIRLGFLKELAKGLGKTRKAVSAVMASIETEPEKRVSFAEAVQFLDGKLDLEAARTDAVKSHGRWGLVDALVNAGDISDAAEYTALFDKATINEADLKRVCKMLERGKKVLPIFDAGAMTPDELFALLFTEGGVPHYTDSYGFKNLAKLRKINPKDIPDLNNLAGKSHDEQLAAFKAAYDKADPMKPTGARVTFTPDKREVSRTGMSATEDMQAFEKGEMAFIDPNADFLRYRTQMDAGLRNIACIPADCDRLFNAADRAFLERVLANKTFDSLDNAAYRALLDKAFVDKTIDEYMPDREKITRYPTYAFENGGVPCLGFDPDYREVGVCYFSPDFAHVFLGGRISLG